MKRKLFLYVSFILLCGMAVLLFCTTAYAGCGMNHSYVADGDNEYVLEYLHPSEDGDVWGIKEYQTCSMCFHQRAVVIEGTEVVKPHDLQFIKDLGHGVGEHFYLYNCRYCGYTETWTLVCDGPPCVRPWMKLPENEDIEIMESGEMEVE